MQRNATDKLFTKSSIIEKLYSIFDYLSRYYERYPKKLLRLILSLYAQKGVVTPCLQYLPNNSGNSALVQTVERLTAV